MTKFDGPIWRLCCRLSRSNATLRRELRDLKAESVWLHQELEWLKRQGRGTG